MLTCLFEEHYKSGLDVPLFSDYLVHKLESRRCSVILLAWSTQLKLQLNPKRNNKQLKERIMWKSLDCTSWLFSLLFGHFLSFK